MYLTSVPLINKVRPDSCAVVISPISEINAVHILPDAVGPIKG